MNMSDGMNKVVLLGHLGANPILRYTAVGAPVLHIRLATNESYVDRNKEVQEKTEWHDVVVWGARAEALAKILGKGSGILVEGGLRTTAFEKDGVKRYRTEVIAREICLTGRRSESVATPENSGLFSNGSNGASNVLELTEELPM